MPAECARMSGCVGCDLRGSPGLHGLCTDSAIPGGCLFPPGPRLLIGETWVGRGPSSQGTHVMRSRSSSQRLGRRSCYTHGEMTEQIPFFRPDVRGSNPVLPGGLSSWTSTLHGKTAEGREWSRARGGLKPRLTADIQGGPGNVTGDGGTGAPPAGGAETPPGARPVPKPPLQGLLCWGSGRLVAPGPLPTAPAAGS